MRIGQHRLGVLQTKITTELLSACDWTGKKVAESFDERGAAMKLLLRKEYLQFNLITAVLVVIFASIIVFFNFEAVSSRKGDYDVRFEDKVSQFAVVTLHGWPLPMIAVYHFYRDDQIIGTHWFIISKKATALNVFFFLTSTTMFMAICQYAVSRRKSVAYHK